LNRFHFHELSLIRIWNAFIRRIRDIPHLLMWRFGREALENRGYLAKHINAEKGGRCFILANGPSLSQMDLSPLKHEITFGLNRIYLLFEKMGFFPTYYVCVNELVLQQFSGEISALPMSKFLNWNSRRVFQPADSNTGFVRLSLSLSDGFQPDMRASLYSGGTVTYVALQIAYSMGFSQVILVGLDHSFSDKGTPNATVIRTDSVDANHFHPEYFPKGTKWQLPDLRRSEAAYRTADRYYRAAGRRILDATPGGKCPVFQRVEYQDLFPSLES
jgi:hypothetical protein